ncbi:MAG: hypothetical protein KF789_09955 [Bdellovibrionaceae bacterium]|nr:hypothetical protein [Pseudobdellovibrionaceae bacterium]
MIRCLFSRSFFPVLATLEIVSALALAVVPSVGWVLLLMVSHLMICIRFRGTYNGGSDMMTFVVLTGLLIGLIVGEERGYQIGLLYIALHAGYSYLKAGLVKFAQKDWRTGAALPVFLGRSLLPPARALGLVLESRPVLTAGLSWLVIVFEIAIFGLLFVPEWSLFYAGLALGFHFGNFLLFGLNRFFWIWLAAWPALLSGLSLSLS